MISTVFSAALFFLLVHWKHIAQVQEAQEAYTCFRVVNSVQKIYNVQNIHRQATIILLSNHRSHNSNKISAGRDVK